MENNRVETVKMLIQFYNLQAGVSTKLNNERNQKIISELLDTGAKVADIKSHIREWVRNHPESATNSGLIRECMLDFEQPVE